MAQEGLGPVADRTMAMYQAASSLMGQREIITAGKELSLWRCFNDDVVSAYCCASIQVHAQSQ
jgi:hypothetical protein